VAPCSRGASMVRLFGGAARVARVARRGGSQIRSRESAERSAEDDDGATSQHPDSKASGSDRGGAARTGPSERACPERARLRSPSLRDFRVPERSGSSVGVRSSPDGAGREDRRESGPGHRERRGGGRRPGQRRYVGGLAASRSVQKAGYGDGPNEGRSERASRSGLGSAFSFSFRRRHPRGAPRKSERSRHPARIGLDRGFSLGRKRLLELSSRTRALWCRSGRDRERQRRPEERLALSTRSMLRRPLPSRGRRDPAEGGNRGWERVSHARAPNPSRGRASRRARENAASRQKEGERELIAVGTAPVGGGRPGAPDRSEPSSKA
jgi:hypothetical protein